MDWSTLHFARPWWFLGLLPVLVLLLTSLRRKNADSPWRKACDDHLLEHLWLSPPGRLSHKFLFLLGAGWLLTIIALAGPVWERQPQPVFRAEMSRVIILDLSASMNAVDLAPSRLQRARFKLSDILNLSREGRTALIVFAGEAHIVTPLTSDTATIATMISALETDIVPAPGNRVSPALQLAEKLLAQAEARLGQVIVITDGIDDLADSLGDIQRLKAKGFPLSVLGVGTEVGAPIPTAEGGFAGMSRLVPAKLIELSNAGGGAYSSITADESDLNKILKTADKMERSKNSHEDVRVERWVEHGIWLLPIILLLASTGLRKGWLGIILVVIVIPVPSEAFDWSDLWLRQDQQGIRSLKQNQPERAAELFKNKAWRAASFYQAGQFDQAAAEYARVEGINGNYNRGNALARAGHLQEAIAAYQEVLEINPEHPDAKFNQQLLKDLLKQNQPPSDQNNPPPPLPKQKEEKRKPLEPEEQKPGEQKSQPQKNQSKGETEKQEQAQKDRQPKDPSKTEKDDAEAARRDAEQQMKQNQQQDTPQAKKQPRPEELNKLPSEDTPPSKTASAELPGKESPPDPQLDQWLRQVPDDPSGLLRRKFMLEHLRRKNGDQK